MRFLTLITKIESVNLSTKEVVYSYKSQVYYVSGDLSITKSGDEKILTESELVPNTQSSKGVEVKKDWYQDLIERIEVRFGDKIPKHYKSEMSNALKNGSNNPYRYGCSHNIKTNKKRDKRFNNPFAVPCKVKESVSVLRPTLNHGDPLAWIDLKYKVTYHHIVNRNGKDLTIRTRSDLIGHDEYIQVLDKINHKIEIIISPYDENELSVMEPGAPSNERRLATFNKLKELGFNVKLIQSNKKEVA